MAKSMLKTVLSDQLTRKPYLTFQLSKNIHQVARLSNLTNEQIRLRRSKLFEDEKKKQLNRIPRLEKIEVKYVGSPEEAVMIMNKNISSPFNVAQHMSEMLCDRSALALVNGQIWDMHRPLEEDCTVELLHFHTDDPFQVNRAFWRSCSFLLGAAVERSFRDDLLVQQHSFPPPNVASGSFVADIDLGLQHDWEPSREEMMVFSAQMHRMAERKLPFQRLTVDAKFAEEMFEENQYKLSQLPSIAGSSGDGHSVTLYKVGDHVDISAGPMVGDSSFLGRRCTVPVAHKIAHNDMKVYRYGSLVTVGNILLPLMYFRFQGVALPKDVYLNHYAFNVLEKRASRLNMAGLQTTKVPKPV